MRLGIDFGTTNSAVAVRDGGTAHLVRFADGEDTQRTVVHCSMDGEITFGNQAFHAYVEDDLTGRFLRSLKTFLPQEVPSTTLGGRRMAFVDIISAYIRFLLERTARALGETPKEVVFGRPVVFAEDSPGSRRAEDTLRQAIEMAGVTHYRFQLEPVAAARRYEADIAADRLVLVGDFGGGTSDFGVIRVGPGRLDRADRDADVLAVEGVGRAGDYLDGRFMSGFLVPFFGKGAPYRKRYTDELVPWKSSLFTDITRLYDLHRLRDDQVRRGLEFMQTRLVQPVHAERLQRLVFDDLGFPMAHAVEVSKKALSTSDEAPFVFDAFHSDALDFETTVDIDTFRAHSKRVLASYDDAITAVLASAGVREDDIGNVFLTGGTSQLPFVRELFARRFGEERIAEADALTSVAVGLALS